MVLLARWYTILLPVLAVWSVLDQYASGTKQCINIISVYLFVGVFLSLFIYLFN